MEGVISYRPRMGKHKLENLVKNKLHYKSINQFIDHAVAQALNEQFGPHPLAKKIADIVYRAVTEHAELNFIKPTAEETKEIESIADRTLRENKGVSAKALLKKHTK